MEGSFEHLAAEEADKDHGVGEEDDEAEDEEEKDLGELVCGIRGVDPQGVGHEDRPQHHQRERHGHEEIDGERAAAEESATDLRFRNGPGLAAPQTGFGG